MVVDNIFKGYNQQLSDHQWDGYTLIMPCVSVGNVPQLTLDLLINTLLKTDNDSSGQDLELFGYLRSSNVCPFAGPDPFNFKGSLLATSIQVFVSNSKKLVLIQQRSPVYKECRNNFYAELTEFVSHHNFSTILLLSSSFDHFLIPDHKDVDFFPMKYLAKNIDDSMETFLKEKLKLSSIKPVDLYTLKEDPNGEITLPGSGSARAYLKWFSNAMDHSSSSDKKTELVCLVMYCSEGDNRSHAYKYADRVANLLNRSGTVLNIKQKSNVTHLESAGVRAQQSEFVWITPFSWRNVFGDEPPTEIF